MKLGKTLGEIDDMDAREYDEWVRIAAESPWVLGLPGPEREQTGAEIAATFRAAAAQVR